jgi:O-antigen ligase
MSIKNKKFVPWLIIVVLLVWIVMTPSPYQKGGVDPLFSLIVPGFVIFISILIGLLFDNFKLFERLIISVIFGIISLFIISFYITPYSIELLYRDKTWFFWETKHRLFINAIYYGLNTILLIALLNLYFKLRQQNRIKTVGKEE